MVKESVIKPSKPTKVMKALKLAFVALALVFVTDSIAFNVYIDKSEFSAATISYEPLRKIEYGDTKYFDSPKIKNASLHFSENKAIKTVPVLPQENLMPSQVILNSLLEGKEKFIANGPAPEFVENPENQVKEGSFMESLVTIFTDYGVFGGIISILIIFTGLRYSMGGRF